MSLIQDARAVVAEFGNPPVTHYEGCRRVHPVCMVKALVDAMEEAEQANTLLRAVTEAARAEHCGEPGYRCLFGDARRCAVCVALAAARQGGAF